MSKQFLERFPKLRDRTFWLAYKRASNIIDRRLEDYYQREHGMGSHALWTLLCAEERPSSQALIAEALNINPNVMVRVVDRMESDGIVRRVRNKDNRREHILVVTPLGKKHLKRIHKTFENVAQMVFSPMSLEELRNLKRNVSRIIESE